MQYFALVAVALASVSSVSATVWNVSVGEGGGLTYTPNVVNASDGDIINFLFLAKNHTVTQSTFTDPCTQMTTPSLGVNSGFMPVAANATVVPQFSITVNNASSPLWFFCEQTGHCEQGMVFAVNPTANKTFEAFQAAANATVLSTNTSSSAASSATGSSSGTPSGSAVTGSPSTTGSPSGALAKTTFNAAGLLTAVGLVAGLLL